MSSAFGCEGLAWSLLLVPAPGPRAYLQSAARRLWDEIIGVWISLCSCRTQHRVRGIAEDGSSGCFIFGAGQSSVRVHRLFMPSERSRSAVAVISAQPSEGPGRCRQTATSLTPPLPRPPLSFAVPSAISSLHSSPASRQNKEHAEAGRSGGGVMKKKAPLGH